MCAAKTLPKNETLSSLPSTTAKIIHYTDDVDVSIARNWSQPSVTPGVTLVICYYVDLPVL